MARLNTAAELWDYVSEVGVIRDVSAGASTTTTAGITAGDTSVSVTSETGFSTGDFVRIGSGESMELAEVESTAAGSLTLVSPVAYDQVTGVAVVEQEKVNLGHISEGGVTTDVSEDVFEVRAATSAQVLSRRTTGITQNISWASILFSIENIATAFGIPESEIGGAGSAADPRVIRTVADKMNTDLYQSLYLTGVLEDGAAFEVRGWNVTFDLNASSTFARNAVAELPTGGEVKTLEFRKVDV